jgi:hypothetical protein
MKKGLLFGLLAAAGGAAYLLSKAANKKEEEKTIITLSNDEDESTAQPQEEKPAEAEPETLEEEPAEEEPQYSREVQEINLMYPYLKPAFISACLKEQLDFDQNYPEGSLITIYHDISFPAVEDLITFVRIIKEHDYQINEADGDQSLTISKDLLVEKGKILSDILNVSNQVCCLNGQYHAYRLESK